MPTHRTYHVGCQRMNLHAVFVCDDFSSGGSGVGSDDDSVLEDRSANRRAGLRRLREAHGPVAQQEGVPRLFKIVFF